MTQYEITGIILPFYGTQEQTPKGWLICNGEEIKKSEYPNLYNHLVRANPTLKLSEDVCKIPDLRGEFLRGLDLGRNIDSNRTLGSFQDHAFIKHSHSYSDFGYGTQWSMDGHGNEGGTAYKDTGEAGTGNETRPRNIALNFIIKC